MSSGDDLSSQIQKLRTALFSKYGDKFRYWASDETEKHGMGFKIAGVPVSFSVHTQNGHLQDPLIDLQVESAPPGDYIYADVVAIKTLCELIAVYAGPKNLWP